MCDKLIWHPIACLCLQIRRTRYLSAPSAANPECDGERVQSRGGQGLVRSPARPEPTSSFTPGRIPPPAPEWGSVAASLTIQVLYRLVWIEYVGNAQPCAFVCYQYHDSGATQFSEDLPYFISVGVTNQCQCDDLNVVFTFSFAYLKHVRVPK